MRLVTSALVAVLLSVTTNGFVLNVRHFESSGCGGRCLVVPIETGSCDSAATNGQDASVAFGSVGYTENIGRNEAEVTFYTDSACTSLDSVTTAVPLTTCEARLDGSSLQVTSDPGSVGVCGDSTITLANLSPFDVNAHVRVTPSGSPPYPVQDVPMGGSVNLPLLATTVPHTFERLDDLDTVLDSITIDGIASGFGTIVSLFGNTSISGISSLNLSPGDTEEGSSPFVLAFANFAVPESVTWSGQGEDTGPPSVLGVTNYGETASLAAPSNIGEAYVNATQTLTAELLDVTSFVANASLNYAAVLVALHGDVADPFITVVTGFEEYPPAFDPLPFTASNESIALQHYDDDTCRSFTSCNVTSFPIPESCAVLPLAGSYAYFSNDSDVFALDTFTTEDCSGLPALTVLQPLGVCSSGSAYEVYGDEAAGVSLCEAFSPSPSPSASASITPTVTPTASATPSVTPSYTATPTATASITPSHTVSPSPVSDSASATASMTPSASATSSASPSFYTASASATASASPSASTTAEAASATATASASVSVSASATASATASPSPSHTAAPASLSATATMTASGSASSSASPSSSAAPASASATASATASPSSSPSNPGSSSATASATASPSTSPSNPGSSSATASATASPSTTPSNPGSSSATASATASPSTSPSNPGSSSATASATASSSASPSTPTSASATGSASASPSASPSTIVSASATSSSSSSSSPSATASPSMIPPSASATTSATSTSSPSATSSASTSTSASATPSPTTTRKSASPTPSVTASASTTPSVTPSQDSVSSTPSPSPSASVTPSVTATPKSASATPSPTSSKSRTPSGTPSNTPSVSGTPSAAPSVLPPSVSPTRTVTSTRSPSPSVTRSPGSSVTPSPSASPSTALACPDACSGHGTCLTGTGGCDCQVGFAGLNCATTASGDPCASAGCTAGSVCIPSGVSGTGACASLPGASNSFYYAVSDWSSCDAPCGTGTSTRTVECHQVSGGVDTVLSSLDQCEANLPADDFPSLSRSCNRFSCGEELATVSLVVVYDFAQFRDDGTLLSNFVDSFLTEIASLLSITRSRLQIDGLLLDQLRITFSILPDGALAPSHTRRVRRQLQTQTPLDLANTLKAAIDDTSSDVYTQGSWLRRVAPTSVVATKVTTNPKDDDKTNPLIYVAVGLGSVIALVVGGIAVNECYLKPRKFAKGPKVVDKWQPSRQRSVRKSGGRTSSWDAKDGESSTGRKALRTDRSARAMALRKPTTVRHDDTGMELRSVQDSAWAENPLAPSRPTSQKRAVQVKRASPLSPTH